MLYSDPSRRRTWEENYDITTINTPVQVEKLHKLICLSNYDSEKTNFLVQRFSEGFDMGYTGPTLRQDTAKNLPFSVGDKFDLWDKLMKEVKLGWVAGPFTQIPYHNYIQSPISLVPKQGNKTRLIFHLSFDFPSGNSSFNASIPKEACSVKYKDLEVAIKYCLQLLQESSNGARIVYFSKTDLVSAFRLVPCRVRDFRWLVMMAYDPWDGKKYFFLDKNLPFGSSKSCSLFQDFSDGLAHISHYILGNEGFVVNYLDDFLFINLDMPCCNAMLDDFVYIYGQVGVNVAPEKTEEADTQVTFLGIILDGVRHILIIPESKRIKALNLLQWVTARKKVTVRILQSLAGILNFLHKLFSLVGPLLVECMQNSPHSWILGASCSLVPKLSSITMSKLITNSRMTQRSWKYF